jgi:HK97 family phage portal protein
MLAEAFSSLLSVSRSGGPRMLGNASLENPNVGLSEGSLAEFWGGGSRSAAGVQVNHVKALTIAAVYQAVSIVSGDIAKLPLYPYKRLPDDDREIFDSHPWYFPVAIRANPQKSAKRFWRDFAVHCLVWGNGYAYISRGKRELYNLLPDRTAPEWHRGKLVYVTEVDGELKALDPSQVLHVYGISLDSTKGMDVVQMARDDWGLELAARNFESKFFKNGARMGGILELPQGIPKPARDNVEEGFRKTYEEGDNPFKTVVLREGAKFHAGQVSPQQGQVSELREDRKREVASRFNVPPSMLGIRDSVSYNSFEQERLAYLHGCLHHWLSAIADECDMKLLSEKELRSDQAYFEHNVSKFTAVDWGTQVTKLCELRNAEIVSPNEIRKKLNMPKRTDPGGDEYVNPHTKSATAQATEAGGDDPPPDDSGPTDDVSNRRKAFAGVLNEALERVARRVGRDARQSAKSPAKFLAWVDERAAGHREIFDRALRPAIDAMVRICGGDVDVLCAMAQHAFFDAEEGCMTQLAAFLEPPYTADRLESNVDGFMTNFERTGAGRVAAILLEEPNV